MNQTSHIFPHLTQWPTGKTKPLAPVNAAAIVSNAAPKFSQALKMHLQKAQGEESNKNEFVTLDLNA